MARRAEHWDRSASDQHLTGLARGFIGVASADVPDVARAGVERIQAWCGADWAVLSVLEPATGAGWIASDRGERLRGVIDALLGRPPAALDIASRESMQESLVVPALEDLPADARGRDALDAAGVGALIFHPVLNGAGDVIGCLAVGTFARSIDWHPEVVGRLRIFADAYVTVFERQQIDLARQRTEARYEMLLRTSRDLVCEFDDRGQLIFASATAEEVFGATEADLLGRGFLDWVHPEDRAIAAEAISLDSDLPFDDLILRVRDADGRYHWMEAEGSTFPGMPGPRRIMVLLRDVSERYAHQVELEEHLVVEREITRLSREFVGLESASLAEAFRRALETAADIAECDEAYAVVVVPDLNDGAPNVHTWTRPGFEPTRAFDTRYVTEGRQLHFRSLLLAGESVVIRDIDELPPQAEVERASMIERDIGSYLAFPLIDAGRTVGVLGFAPIGRKVDWSEHQLTILRLVAELFGAVIRRARSEAHLREREERFRVLADQSPDAIIEISQSGRILFASAAFPRLIGDGDDDWVGRSVTELVVPEELPRLLEIRDEGIAGRPIGPAVFRCVRADGSQMHLEASLRPFRTARGDRHAIAILRDVTARLESERTLEQQLLLERQIAEISRDFLTHDFDRFDDDVRRNAALVADLARADQCVVLSLGTGPGGRPELFEWTAHDRPSGRIESVGLLPGRYPYMSAILTRGDSFTMARSSDLPKAAAVDRANFERAGVKSFLAIPFMQEKRLRGVFALATHHEEISWTHGDMGILNLASDIIHVALRRRNAARDLEYSQLQLVQSQKMEAVGTLAGGIAHDFNNQLAVMLGNARFVLEQLREGDEKYEALLDLERAAEHCAQLTRSLLAFSRQATQETRTLDVAAWLADVAELVKPLLPSTIRFSVEVSEDVGAVRGDPTQLQQVMVNLLVNARDAMPRGGHISVRAGRATLTPERMQACEIERAEVLELCVQDDGSGMDEAVRDRIFEPFFTTKALGQGTGLGLATVYGIVKQCGGHIEVESEPGAGSTFRVLLPSEHGLAVQPAPAAEEVIEPTRSFDTVLLVEDEPAVRRVLRRMLDTRAKRVIEAHDGDEALAILEQRLDEIDLLVTDMVMPRMGGLALSHIVARRRPGLPTLFLSGYPDDALDLDQDLGRAQRFLQKPFTQRDLMQALESLLETRE